MYTTMANTVSFPLATLGAKVGKEELYKVLYQELTKSMKEEDVAGIQIYPSDWPRKVQITLRDKGMKEKLAIEGIDIFGMHVELKDESSVLQKVIVRDAPIEWDDNLICDILCGYGKIVRIQREMIYYEGQKTSWTTGTRYVYMCPIEIPIPTRLTIPQGDQQVTISVWYQRKDSQGPRPVKCAKCGEHDHATSWCKQEQKVCYICKSSAHVQKDCPQNDGCKHSDSVVCFMSEKSVLSNFNMECPVTIGSQTYTCNEQYIQAEKAAMFMDFERAEEIMACSNPREMKRLGNKIRNYNDKEWKEAQHDVVITCVREKFKSHAKARQYLLDTGSKKIGEATKSRVWGIGYHISEPNVLNVESWAGANKMGKILEEVREEIRSEEVDDLIQSASMQMQAAASLVSSDKNKETGDESQVVTEVPMDTTTPDPKSPSPPPEVTTNHSDVTTGSNPQHPEKDYCVCIGDSNVKDMEIAPHIPADMLMVAVSGTAVEDVESRVKEIQLGPKEVKVVALHVGTCSWKYTGKVTDAEAVYREYVEALTATSTKFPHAEIVISSVPPRIMPTTLIGNVTSQRVNDINSEAEKLNRKLRLLTEGETNLSFCDNDPGLKLGDTPCEDLYSKTDITGVHLNKKGKCILEDNLTDKIREAFYKCRLQHEWDIIPMPKK